MTSCSKELRPAETQKHPLQITTRAPGGPDFKFELLPLHSPLLRQSLLVSFPPLIDMLKFSGYSYLIRGQPLVKRGFDGCGRPVLPTYELLLNTPGVGVHADSFRGGRPRGAGDSQYQAVLDW